MPSASMARVSIRVWTMCGDPASLPGTMRSRGRGARGDPGPPCRRWRMGGSGRAGRARAAVSRRAPRTLPSPGDGSRRSGRRRHAARRSPSRGRGRTRAARPARDGQPASRCAGRRRHSRSACAVAASGSSAAPSGRRTTTASRDQPRRRGRGSPGAPSRARCSSERPRVLRRGLDFLVSHSRLNVAASPAQCLSYLVCSPRLLEVDCRRRGSRSASAGGWTAPQPPPIRDSSGAQLLQTDTLPGGSSRRYRPCLIWHP